MTDAPWDEGPVSALRARIQELEGERDSWRRATGNALAENGRLVASVSAQAGRAVQAEADRDRAVDAVKVLRAQLGVACVLRKLGHYEDALDWTAWDAEALKVLAATAAYEETPDAQR